MQKLRIIRAIFEADLIIVAWKLQKVLISVMKALLFTEHKHIRLLLPRKDKKKKTNTRESLQIKWKSNCKYSTGKHQTIHSNFELVEHFLNLVQMLYCPT